MYLTCKTEGEIKALKREDLPLVDKIGKYMGDQKLKMSKTLESTEKHDVFGGAGGSVQPEREGRGRSVTAKLMNSVGLFQHHGVFMTSRQVLFP